MSNAINDFKCRYSTFWFSGLDISCEFCPYLGWVLWWWPIAFCHHVMISHNIGNVAYVDACLSGGIQIYLCNSWKTTALNTVNEIPFGETPGGNNRFYFACWWHALSDPLSSRLERHRISTHCLAIWIYWNNFLAKIEMTFYELLYWT